MWSAVKGPVESGPICDKYEALVVGPHVNEMYSRADFLLAACQTTFKVVWDS